MRLRDINRFNKVRAPKGKVVWGYQPTPRQLEAHQAGERYKLYGGAMGGGKSVWLCAEALILLLKYPGNRGLLARQHMIDFRRSTLKTFEKVVPKELIKRHIMDDHIIQLWNGSELVYSGLGNQEEMERVKSTEFGFVGIDEATETLEEMFILLSSRLRWRLPNGRSPQYFMLLASNPEPGWVKDRFVDNRNENHLFIPALPKDNPHLPKGYDDELRKMFPEEAARRYLDGSWDIFEGQIYKEFDKSKHIYTDDQFDSENSQYFERFRVIDHGYTNPTCCLWCAVDFAGRIWVYDEHYQAGLTIEENSKIIRDMHGDDFLTLCDPSMFSRTMQKGRKVWSPADEYRENGIPCVKPFEDGSSRIPEVMGINMVKQRFKNDTLFIHAKCVNTIKEIIKASWKRVRLTDMGKGNATEQPLDKDNHATDCIRYGCMWRPSNSAPPVPPVPINSLHYAIQKHKSDLNRPFMAGW